jgi:hypothetical protein
VSTFLKLGAYWGVRHHTTIMHGWEKVQSEVTNNDRVRREIAAVLESLRRLLATYPSAQHELASKHRYTLTPILSTTLL